MFAMTTTLFSWRSYPCRIWIDVFIAWKEGLPLHWTWPLLHKYCKWPNLRNNHSRNQCYTSNTCRTHPLTSKWIAVLYYCSYLCNKYAKQSFNGGVVYGWSVSQIRNLFYIHINISSNVSHLYVTSKFLGNLFDRLGSNFIHLFFWNQ